MPSKRVQLVCLLAGMLVAASAHARGFRRVFEPTDLELEGAGTAELDLQAGFLRGPDAFRLAVPDAELDLGLARNLELDLDGAFALEGPPDGRVTYDHLAPDNLWLAAKAGLLGYRDSDIGMAWSLAVQLGPKWPLANGAHGLGGEGLLLLGFHTDHTHLALNAGGLVDPAVDAQPRPRGWEGGVDLEQDLDRTGHWKLKGEVGGIAFRSADSNQGSATLGLGWGPSDDFEVSLVLLRGLVAGSDRYGVLLGVSPKAHLW